MFCQPRVVPGINQHTRYQKIGAVELRPILIMSLSEKKCLFHNQMKVMEGLNQDFVQSFF